MSDVQIATCRFEACTDNGNYLRGCFLQQLVISPLTSLPRSLGVDYPRENFAVVRLMAAPSDLWSLLSKYNDEGDPAFNDSNSSRRPENNSPYLSPPSIHLFSPNPSPAPPRLFFAPLMLVTRHTLVFQNGRRSGCVTRALFVTPGDNVKISDVRARLFSRWNFVKRAWFMNQPRESPPSDHKTHDAPVK